VPVVARLIAGEGGIRLIPTPVSLLVANL